MRRAFVVASVALASCTTIAGIGDYVIGECKGGNCTGDADTGALPSDSGPAPADDSGVPCQGTAEPLAVRIGSPGNTFCIDSTEVTVGQYKAFLAAGVAPSSQPPACVWNTSFAPDPSDAGANVPVTGVDWCDALAYCTWAGKYLCGVVENGKKVGPVTLERTSDFRSHQWLLACSAEARQRYPYGGLFDPSKCNLADYDAGAPVPATSTCVGGYAGIHDMIGNVWEWYDGPCRADGSLEVDGGDGGPASDNCFLKGGSFLDRGGGYDCRLDINNIRRDHHGTNVGFRCCSD
jgi:formylglycine-generating enzyme